MKAKPYKKSVSMTELDHENLEALAEKMGVDANFFLVHLLRNATRTQGLEAFGSVLTRIEDRTILHRDSLEILQRTVEAAWQAILILGSETLDQMKLDPEEFERRKREALEIIKRALSSKDDDRTGKK